MTKYEGYDPACILCRRTARRSAKIPQNHRWRLKKREQIELHRIKAHICKLWQGKKYHLVPQHPPPVPFSYPDPIPCPLPPLAFLFSQRMSLTSLGRYDLCQLILSWMLGCALRICFTHETRMMGKGKPLSPLADFEYEFHFGSLINFLC